MSIIRNRELSQFGSFIFVDNASENIAITEGALPYVGIGTTSPQYKFDVLGDSRFQGNFEVTGDNTVQGNLEASSYTLNGNPLVDATIEYWKFGTGGDDIYRLQGNVGIGTSVLTEKLTVDGNVSAEQFISTVPTGTAPFEVSSLTLVTHLNADYLRGKTPPSGDIVGNNDSQILTNKTINLASNTLSGTTSQFNIALSDDNFATLTGTETLTNKTLTTPVITGIRPSAGQLQTVPSGTGTLVSTNSSGVVTSAMIADGTIVNGDISASASISVSKLSASTISGVSLGSNLNDLTAGSYITYNSGSTYNGSSAITIGVAGTTVNTANTLVARNASGDFSAGTINCANLTASFNVTAADFNSTSDINLKTNIHTVENALDTVSQLRGVSFDWKETGKGSYGVIAQEVEELLPELVTTKDNKSVNYNGLVGVLIEAIKELKKEVEELKNNK